MNLMMMILKNYLWKKKLNTFKEVGIGTYKNDEDNDDRLGWLYRFSPKTVFRK